MEGKGLLLRVPAADRVLLRPELVRLARVRAQGYATTVDELEEGLAGVSVGIFGAAGALLGTVNVSGLGRRLGAAARERAAGCVRAVVEDIEAALR